MVEFRWHWRHRPYDEAGPRERRRGDIDKNELNTWGQSVKSAAEAIERWPDSDRRKKDWNLRQLEIRRRSIERGEKQT